ncbi:hypothetical protein BDV25DRAFT_140802 [Aspergillus avenaceus]|uniref:Uncharacterized protein n=1 Tax=Aspergillus avenaceus TaxID=36643 RepID=A0A5N6TTM0_ASPAV|nr:hypothetical protein BDV25DRAFT_140802 [Aspergillus avenaceus]
MDTAQQFFKRSSLHKAKSSEPVHMEKPSCAKTRDFFCSSIGATKPCLERKRDSRTSVQTQISTLNSESQEAHDSPSWALKWRQLMKRSSRTDAKRNVYTIDLTARFHTSCLTEGENLSCTSLDSSTELIVHTQKHIDMDWYRPKFKSALNVIKGPHIKIQKTKSTTAHFSRMRALQILNACICAIHLDELRNTRSPEYDMLKQPRNLRKLSSFLDLGEPEEQMGLVNIGRSTRNDRQSWSTVRWTAASMYNKRVSRAVLAALHPEAQKVPNTGVNIDEEDHGNSPWLLPYREWRALFYRNTNTEEAFQRQQTFTRPPTPFPDHLLPSHPESTSPDIHSWSPTDDIISTHSSSSSFVITTPHNAHSVHRISSPLRDPFADSREDLNTMEQVDKISPSSSPGFQSAEYNDNKDSIHDGIEEEESVHKLSTSEGCLEKESVSKDPKAHGIPVPPLSRIPRVLPGHKLGQKPAPAPHKEVRVTSRRHSSIPIPIRKPAVEGQRSELQPPSSETFSKGIRVLEEPFGPQHSHLAEQKSLLTADSPEPASTESIHTSPSPSVASDPEFEEMARQRPTNIYTGEYRSRPTLRIARSAERIIMGPDSPENTPSATQRPKQAIAHYLGPQKRDCKKEPIMAVAEDAPSTPGSHASDSSSVESIRGSLNERTRVALEGLQKRDFSGREIEALHRKSPNSPNISKLLTPSPKTEVPPVVPEIPARFDITPTKGRAIEPITPMKTTFYEPEDLPFTPGSVESDATIKPLLQHTPLRRAVSDSTMSEDPGQQPLSSITVRPDDAAQSEHKTTFDDILPHTPSQEQVFLSPAECRVSDSRGNRMLDSFRSIFKHKVALDKERSISGYIETPKSKPPSVVKSLKTPDNNKLGAVRTGIKAGARYTKLSDTWTKSSLTLRSSTKSPMRQFPSISAPMPLSSDHVFEDNMPSFARSTKATRIRAASSPRGQKSMTPQGLVHKLSPVSVSTGSPEIPARVSRTTQPQTVSLPKTTDQKKPAEVDRKDTPNAPEPRTISASGVKRSAQGISKEISACVDKLCTKARDGDTPVKREEYLRLALSLQQMLHDFKGLDKEVQETEAVTAKKRVERDLAEDVLFEAYAQIQCQIDEE